MSDLQPILSQSLSNRKDWFITEQILPLICQIDSSSCQTISIKTFDGQWKKWDRIKQDYKKNQQDYDFISDILVIIEHVRFTDLIEIYLLDSGIVNLESLAFLDMQSLRTINFMNNCLTSLKAFAKTNFRLLETIDIRSNYINTVDISRGRMNPRSNFLDCDFIESWVQLIDYRLLMKIEPQELEERITLGFLSKNAKNKNMYRFLINRFAPDNIGFRIFH